MLLANKFTNRLQFIIAHIILNVYFTVLNLHFSHLKRLFCEMRQSMILAKICKFTVNLSENYKFANLYKCKFK